MSVPARLTDFQPPFLGLPIAGDQAQRWVGTTIMDSEQYHVEGWHVVDRFRGAGTPDDAPPDVMVWAAEVPGLMAYGTLQAKRRAEGRWRAAERAREEAAYRGWVDTSRDVSE